MNVLEFPRESRESREIPLVNITDFASPPSKESQEQRFLKYQLQSAARHVLLDQQHRVRICLRHQREKYGTVDVFKHRKTQKAFYGGLMVCGSTWVCPVCASKITERRRSELLKAFQAHKRHGGQMKMLTLTFSHSKKDKLHDLIVSFTKALRRFQSGKRYAKIRERLGYVGTVRAFEITYGENGWHPHIHLLIFHKYVIDPSNWNEIEDIYYDLWSGACALESLETSRKYGIKLDDAEHADTYIAKYGEEEKKITWSADMEMTKSNSKKGRGTSLTPFDFLRAIVEDGDLSYENQFKEFAQAVRNVPQLRWSKGLKDLYEIDDKSDEQLAEEKTEEADLLGGLSWGDWRYILDNNLRAKLLDYIEQHGYVDALIKIGLKKEKETDRLISPQL